MEYKSRQGIADICKAMGSTTARTTGCSRHSKARTRIGQIPGQSSRCRAARKLSPEARSLAIELARQSTFSLKSIMVELIAESSIPRSAPSARVLKEDGLSYQRTRYSLKKNAPRRLRGSQTQNSTLARGGGQRPLPCRLRRRGRLHGEPAPGLRLGSVRGAARQRGEGGHAQEAERDRLLRQGFELFERVCFEGTAKGSDFRE